jgi:hypothetical protein
MEGERGKKRKEDGKKRGKEGERDKKKEGGCWLFFVLSSFY